MIRLKNILLPVLVLLTGNIYAQTTYVMSDNYVVSIEGGSNLHGWTESVKKAAGKSSINWDNNGGFDLDALNLFFNVRSIKSTEGSIMDNKTYDALKADENPNIIFVLTAPLKVSTNSTVVASGNLTIAGVSHPVTIEVKVITDGKDKIVFEGAKKINMLDYGVKPPTALMGMLKVTNDVTISFKATFINNSI